MPVAATPGSFAYIWFMLRDPHEVTEITSVLLHAAKALPCVFLDQTREKNTALCLGNRLNDGWERKGAGGPSTARLSCSSLGQFHDIRSRNAQCAEVQERQSFPTGVPHVHTPHSSSNDSSVSLANPHPCAESISMEGDHRCNPSQFRMA